MKYEFWSFFAVTIFASIWMIALYNLKKHKKENKNFDSLMESVAIFKRQHQIEKDEIYRERNILVALLAQTYPSGIKKTVIEGWSPEWHNCVYIELPDGSQCSWHYHDDDSYLFENLPPYEKEWDGHTTENKYFIIEELIVSGSIKRDTNLENSVSNQIQDLISSSPSILDISLNSQNEDYRETMVTLHGELQNMTISKAMEKWVKHADVDSSSFPKPSIYPVAVKDNNTEQTDGVIELITKFENPKK